MENAAKGKNKIVELYPLTKFYLAIAAAIVAIVLPGILSKVICFLALNVLAIVSGVYPVFIRRVRNSVGILFLVLLVVQILFALKLGFILASVGSALIWFFAVTTEKDFVLALEKKGLSPKASYVVLSTLQMVPVLKKRSQTIMNAQKARGVETEGNIWIRAKVFVPTIVPLVLSSIQGTEERALTLEARGFSVETPSTHLYDIEPKPMDRVMTIVITVVFLLIILGRVLLWVI